jgi:pimeloyl-ACP methyl ester carboxylesterase
MIIKIRINLILAILICIQSRSVNAQYQSFELSDSSSIRTLKGTLLMPSDSKGKIPLVVIIAGSGPTDRDGNSPGLKSDYLKMVAEGLAIHNIASFRYDKRGVGNSKVRDLNEELLVFEDFVGDASDWILRFKSDKRFSKIIVAGHSEGALIGMLAVQSSNVNGLITLAGTGRPLDVVIMEQLRSNPYNPPQLINESQVILDSLKAGHRVKKVNPLLMALFRPSVQPFLISIVKYDPAKVLNLVSVPIMIVQGTTDVQVSSVDAELLHTAKPDARYVLIEGMNHVLRDAPADRLANIAVYSLSTKPLSASLIPELVAFVKSIK